MELNKKGFTLIELVAVLFILGIISGIAIGGTSIYLKRTKEKAYEALEVTLYNAAQQYIIDRGVLVPDCLPAGASITACSNPLTLTAEQLIQAGYIKDLDDPSSKSNGQCDRTNSFVNISRKKGTGKNLDKYNYAVHLECQSYANDINFEE